MFWCRFILEVKQQYTVQIFTFSVAVTNLLLLNNKLNREYCDKNQPTASIDVTSILLLTN